MKNIITIIRNTFMYVTIFMIAVCMVSFVLNTIKWFVHMAISNQIPAVGYMLLGIVMVIGTFTAIDKIRQ